MNIVVACKMVPDDQDIVVRPDGSLDYSKAKQTVSAYDLNAIEAAAQLAASVEGSKLIAISVGEKAADDSKLRKNVLARGVDELYLVADDAMKDADTFVTASALAKLVATVEGEAGKIDLIICGDGSADVYAQQVDAQLAALLGLPVVNGVVSIEPQDGSVKVERMLEACVETVMVPLPAVVSVTPDIALPRICGMKDILAAGKKPATVTTADDYAVDAVIEVVDTKAPEQKDRAQKVFDASEDGALDAFVQAAVAAIK